MFTVYCHFNVTSFTKLVGKWNDFTVFRFDRYRIFVCEQHKIFREHWNFKTWNLFVSNLVLIVTLQKKRRLLFKKCTLWYALKIRLYVLLKIQIKLSMKRYLLKLFDFINCFFKLFSKNVHLVESKKHVYDKVKVCNDYEIWNQQLNVYRKKEANDNNKAILTFVRMTILT